MDWNLVQGSWQHFRGEVYANWARFSGPDLDFIGGNRARLATQIEEVYGVTVHEAERQIRSFEARNQYPRPVSFR